MRSTSPRARARSISRARASSSARRADRQRARAGTCARVPRRALRAPLDAGGSRGARGRHRERARGEPAAARAAGGSRPPESPSCRESPRPPRRRLADAPAAAPPRRSPRRGTLRVRVSSARRLSRRSMAPATVYPERQRRARSSASTETAAPATAPRWRRAGRRRPAGGARGGGARGAPKLAPADRERADQRAVEHGRRGRGEPIHDLRDLVVHRSVGRSSFRSMYRGVRFGRRMAFDLRLRRVRLFALAPRIVAGCASRVPRDAGTLAHRTPRLSALVDVRARLLLPRRGIHRGRRGGGRRGGEAHRHIFRAEVLASSSNAHRAAFRTDGGGPRAVSERSARASAPRARSTHTSRRAPPVLRSQVADARLVRARRFPRGGSKLSPRSRGKNLPIRQRFLAA